MNDSKRSQKRRAYKEGWRRKLKGGAYVWLHPESHEGRGIVENQYGVHFNGKIYTTLEKAMEAALATN